MTNETTTTTLDSLLEGFRPYNAPAPEKTTPVITIRTRTINFNKAAMIALGYSPYCSIHFSDEKKQIVIHAADNGQPFYKKRDGKQDMVRWASFQITQDFMDFAGLKREELPHEGIKFTGTPYPDIKAIVFNMQAPAV